MKRVLFLVLAMLVSTTAFAMDDTRLAGENKIQSRINSVGTKILNANKLEKRVTFVYDEEGKKSLLKAD